ncbi:hypothetical protein [Streptomyces prunicolor]
MRFLSATSAEPAGRVGVIYGEIIYTGSLLESHLADPSLFDGPREQVLANIGKNAGVIEGIVGHSVADSDVKAAVDGEVDYNNALAEKGNAAKSWVNIAFTGLKLPEHLGGEVMCSVVGGAARAVAGGAVDRLLEGQEMRGAKDEGLYASAKDLYAMRDSVNQQTQWSTDDALARHHTDLPKDGTDDIVGNAVNDEWDASSEYLSNTKERP